MSNKAAYITEAKANPLQVKDAPFPSAGKGEVVVKNHAVAVNPVDCELDRCINAQDNLLTQRREDSRLWSVNFNVHCGAQLTLAGIFLQKYPNILGTDVAGEVHEVGEGVTHVKKGDRVLGYV